MIGIVLQHKAVVCSGCGRPYTSVAVRIAIRESDRADEEVLRPIHCNRCGATPNLAPFYYWQDGQRIEVT